MLLHVNSITEINGSYCLAMSQSPTQVPTVNRPLLLHYHCTRKCAALWDTHFNQSLLTYNVCVYRSCYKVFVVYLHYREADTNTGLVQAANVSLVESAPVRQLTLAAEEEFKSRAGENQQLDAYELQHILNDIFAKSKSNRTRFLNQW